MLCNQVNIFIFLNQDNCIVIKLQLNHFDYKRFAIVCGIEEIYKIEFIFILFFLFGQNKTTDSVDGKIHLKQALQSMASLVTCYKTPLRYTSNTQNLLFIYTTKFSLFIYIKSLLTHSTR